MEYIGKIHRLHEQLLVKGSEKYTKPIKVVDGNGTMDKVFHDTLVVIEEMVIEIEELNEAGTQKRTKSGEQTNTYGKWGGKRRTNMNAIYESNGIDMKN